MSVSFKILPERGLVYVRYDGHAAVADTLRVFAEYARHPDCRPGQKQLVDLSGIASFETDFAKLLELQARKADVFMAEGVQTLIVYHAPTPETRRMARLIERSWEPFSSVVALVQEDEANALALLGQRETRFSDLLEGAS